MAEQSGMCQVPCAKIADVERSLATLVNTVGINTATTELRVRRVEDGVSNYVKFMARMDEFIVKHDATVEANERFHNIRDQEIKDTLGKRDKRLMVALSVLALLVALLAAALALPPAIASVKDLLKADLNWHKLIGSEATMARQSAAPQITDSNRATY